jgi:hypothetical protein
MNEQPGQPFRVQWIPIIAVFTGLALLGALLVQRLGLAALPSAPTLIPTVGPLIDAELMGLAFKQPGSWPAPVKRDAYSFVISPTGSADTATTAGTFVYVVVDALNAFRGQYNVRADLADPAAQLKALLDAANPDAPRFKDPLAFRGAKYRGAFVRGFQRGNGQLVALLRADDGSWIYIGAQAPGDQFAFLEQTVFNPLIASLSVK